MVLLKVKRFLFSIKNRNIDVFKIGILIVFTKSISTKSRKAANLALEVGSLTRKGFTKSRKVFVFNKNNRNIDVYKIGILIVFTESISTKSRKAANLVLEVGSLT